VQKSEAEWNRVFCAGSGRAGFPIEVGSVIKQAAQLGLQGGQEFVRGEVVGHLEFRKKTRQPMKMLG